MRLLVVLGLAAACAGCVPPTIQVQRDCPVGEQSGLADTDVAVRDALVTIPSGRSQAGYREDLRTAVGPVLTREPAARFELVAVAPESSDGEQTAQVEERRAQILQGMIDAGVPAERITLSTVTLPDTRNSEIRVYALPTSGTELAKNYCRIILP